MLIFSLWYNRSLKTYTYRTREVSNAYLFLVNLFLLKLFRYCQITNHCQLFCHYKLPRDNYTI